MSDHEINLAILILTAVGAVAAVLAVVRRRAKPHLVPVFDHAWGSFGAKPPRNELIVRNVGDADALQTSVEPIDWEDGDKLVTNGAQVVIPAGKEHTFVLKRAAFADESPLAAMHETVDVIDVIQKAAVVKALKTHVVKNETWSVFANCQDRHGRRYRCVWRLETDLHATPGPNRCG